MKNITMHLYKNKWFLGSNIWFLKIVFSVKEEDPSVCRLLIVLFPSGVMPVPWLPPFNTMCSQVALPILTFLIRRFYFSLSLRWFLCKNCCFNWYISAPLQSVVDVANEEQSFCLVNDGLSKPSYSSVQRTCWYEVHGLQSDIQKIARLLKKIPDRTFLFYSVLISSYAWPFIGDILSCQYLSF